MDETYEQIRKFEVRDDDVYLVGYPRSGTTWSQEMVWLIGNDLNYEAAKVCTGERFLNIDSNTFLLQVPDLNLNFPECHKDSITFAKNMKKPRYIKLHISPERLPEQIVSGEKKPKIIYVARNVKDVCLSNYHFRKHLIETYNDSLEEFAAKFMRSDSEMGSYWKHVLHFWNRRNEDNILFIKYEDMILNLSNVIQQVATFLNKQLTNDQEQKLIHWLDFNSIKNNTAVNYSDVYNKSGFIRVGKMGEHKKEMSPEIIARFDEWSKEYLEDSDYQ